MASLMAGHHKGVKEICDALGLNHVRKLDIHMEVNSMCTVEAEMHMEIDGAMQIATIFKRFELRPIKEGPIDTTELGDEYQRLEMAKETT